MWTRFAFWLKNSVSVLHLATLVIFCLLLVSSFALGAFLGRSRNALPPNQAPWTQPMDDAAGPLPPRGRFGAIDSIQGNLIRIRDPRSGKTWNVRTRQDTVIEFGRHRRIPFDNLRVGQRIFVTGMPDESNAANEFDADFIGVVLGQPQRFVRPAMEPMWCWDCVD